MTGFGFSSRYKIKKTDEFSSVFNFRKRIAGEFMTLHYKPNALEYARLGLIIGKKTARQAVQRNYMRRVLRDQFRQQRHMLNGMDILIRVHTPFGRLEYARACSELSVLFDRLKRRMPARQA